MDGLTADNRFSGGGLLVARSRVNKADAKSGFRVSQASQYLLRNVHESIRRDATCRLPGAVPELDIVPTDPVTHWNSNRVCGLLILRFYWQVINVIAIPKDELHGLKWGRRCPAVFPNRHSLPRRW